MKSSWNISAKCPSASMETLLASGNSLLNIYKVFFHSGSKSASQIIKFLFLVIFLLVYWKIPFHLVFFCCCCYFFFIHYVCIRPTWLGNRVPPRNHSWLLVEFAICIFHFNNYVNHSQGSGKNHQNCVLNIQYTKPSAVPRRNSTDGQNIGNYSFINESPKIRLPKSKPLFLLFPDGICKFVLPQLWELRDL